MALPASGPISFADINEQLGRSASAPLSLDDEEVRSYFESGTGAVAISQGAGKEYIPKFWFSDNSTGNNRNRSAVSFLLNLDNTMYVARNEVAAQYLVYVHKFNNLKEIVADNCLVRLYTPLGNNPTNGNIIVSRADDDTLFMHGWLFKDPEGYFISVMGFDFTNAVVLWHRLIPATSSNYLYSLNSGIVLGGRAVFVYADTVYALDMATGAMVGRVTTEAYTVPLRPSLNDAGNWLIGGYSSATKKYEIYEFSPDFSSLVRSIAFVGTETSSPPAGTYYNTMSVVALDGGAIGVTYISGDRSIGLWHLTPNGTTFTISDARRFTGYSAVSTSMTSGYRGGTITISPTVGLYAANHLLRQATVVKLNFGSPCTIDTTVLKLQSTTTTSAYAQISEDIGRGLIHVGVSEAGAVPMGERVYTVGDKTVGHVSKADVLINTASTAIPYSLTSPSTPTYTATDPTVSTTPPTVSTNATPYYGVTNFGVYY